MTISERAAAAASRAQQVRAPADRPQARRNDGGDACVRAEMTRVEVARGQQARAAGADSATLFVGYASVTEHAYEMWDFFGPYEEIVTAGAFGATLAASPQVELVVNHSRGGQLPLAHTRNGTLRLSEDATGLRVEADLDEARSDVRDVLAAVERGDLAEMSFKFQINAGRWSEDFATYRINEVDLDRGDVSIVNFGANPHTADLLEVSARSPESAEEVAREEAAAPAPADEPAVEPTTTERSPVVDEVTTVEPTAEVVEPNSDVEALRSRVNLLEEQIRTRTAAEEAARTMPAYDQVARVTAEARTYTAESARRDGVSFLRDVAGAHMGDYDAQSRLARHIKEERTERAEYFSRDVGSAQFAGLTIPQYLVDLVAPTARAGRPLADNCRKLPLPADGMSVVISRITTAPTAAVQTAEAGAVSETDIDDTALTVPVRTIAGQQDVSFQALARSVGVEDVILGDLVGAYHTALDSQIINGDGNSGAHLGIRSTTSISTATLTDSSPTPAEALGSLYEIQATIEGAVFKRPTHLVMAPRRWAWFRAAIGTDVALMSQGSAYGPSTFGTVSGSDYGPGVRGDLAGLAVIVDGNVPLTVSSTQDVILAVNAQELFLWEDPGAPLFIRADQPGAGNLMSKLVVYGYSAFTAGRYPAAHGVISGTGLAAPSAYGKTIS